MRWARASKLRCRPSTRQTRPMQFAGELLLWLRERLAHYKCPKSIAFEPQLPRSDTGKMFKHELVKKYSV